MAHEKNYAVSHTHLNILTFGKQYLPNFKNSTQVPIIHTCSIDSKLVYVEVLMEN